MAQRFVTDLYVPLSMERLESYRRPGGTDVDMAVDYFFNIELSEALYPSLQAIEVTVRNSIHAAVGQHFHTPYWFDMPGIFPSSPIANVLPWQQDAISNARRKLTREKKAHDAGRIVAELHFGFWNSLFNRPFARTLWLPDGGALLARVLPHAPQRARVPRHLESRFNRIRMLRNRVMHYEPIWHRTDLEQRHAQILETLSWISPAMHDTIAMSDRFPDVYRVGRADVERRVLIEIQKRSGST